MKDELMEIRGFIDAHRIFCKLGKYRHGDNSAARCYEHRMEDAEVILSEIDDMIAQREKK